MKIHFKNFVALALSVMLVAGITACKSEFEPGNITEPPKGEIILDTDFVTIRLVNTKERATTETVPYTKDDWAYSTTTVTFDGTNATTKFYSKNASINVECKKEGEYIFKSTAYKADQKTIIATTDPVTKNVTFNNGDFDLSITYTNFNSYEVTTSVTGTIENQWGNQETNQGGNQEEKTAILSSRWFNNTNAPSRNKVKSIKFIKPTYTGSYTSSWSGGENITVYYNSADESIVVSASGLTIYAPENIYGLFASFSSVENIDLSNFDTSNVTNMGFIFIKCRQITTLDVSKFDTSKVTNMEGLFDDCESLTTLDVSNFETSKVTNMNSMFDGCKSLTTLDLTNFDTSKVTNMEDLFNNCESLTTLNVSNFDTSNVTNMSGIFSRCRSLTTLDVSNFDTSNVTNMSGMFSYCESLTTLDLSNFNTSNVTNMSDMFFSCLDLETLIVSTFDTSKVTDISNMFFWCNSLYNLDLSSFDTSNVKDANDIFDNNLYHKVTYNPDTWTLGTNWGKTTFIAK